MKKTVLSFIIALIFTIPALAQLIGLPSGGNKRASVSEQVGITNVTITYNRPGVRKREGHIWGELVPTGYVDQGFGTSKQAPWRAGANENTTIEFSTDVKINGKPLAAGKYGFFIAYGANECTLIFSKNATSWGSFYYNPAEDAMRVTTKPLPLSQSVERLKYEFINQTPSSADVQLQWEKLAIPFKIDVDVVATMVDTYRKELRTDKGFTWTSWDQAAQYCAQNKANLNEALLWADSAVSVNFGGAQNFQAWSTKAAVLDSMGRSTEAIEVMKKAMPFADMTQLYRYGRTLTRNKKGKEAVDIFKANYAKYPDMFLTNVGMARGNSAMGDYKKALTFALKAQKQAPDKANQDIVDKMVKTLQDGKDIN